MSGPDTYVSNNEEIHPNLIPDPDDNFTKEKTDLRNQLSVEELIELDKMTFVLQLF